jgi:hypothetical protein
VHEKGGRQGGRTEAGSEVSGDLQCASHLLPVAESAGCLKHLIIRQQQHSRNLLADASWPPANTNPRHTDPLAALDEGELVQLVDRLPALLLGPGPFLPDLLPCQACAEAGSDIVKMVLVGRTRSPTAPLQLHACRRDRRNSLRTRWPCSCLCRHLERACSCWSKKLGWGSNSGTAVLPLPPLLLLPADALLLPVDALLLAGGCAWAGGRGWGWGGGWGRV